MEKITTTAPLLTLSFMLASLPQIGIVKAESEILVVSDARALTYC